MVSDVCSDPAKSIDYPHGPVFRAERERAWPDDQQPRWQGIGRIVRRDFDAQTSTVQDQLSSQVLPPTVRSQRRVMSREYVYRGLVVALAVVATDGQSHQQADKKDPRTRQVPKHS